MLRNYYSKPLRGALMGQVDQILYGDGFALGFNVSFSVFGPDAEDISSWLERMNLAHEVTSGQIAGVVNPYISVVGRASGNWSTSSSFRDALLGAIGELGFEIDYSSPINYQLMPRPRPTQSAPAPAPSPKVRPRPDAPATPSEEAVYFDVAGEPPREPYAPPAPPPPKKDDGVSSWAWIALAAIGVIAITRR